MAGSIQSREFTPVLFSLLLVLWEMWNAWSYFPSPAQAAQLRASHLDEATGHDPEILCGVLVSKEDVAGSKPRADGI